MFGERGRCECNNQGKCVRGNACYYKKAKAALDRAHDIRKFEIELLWKRAAYVATFQTLLFAALGLSFRADAGDTGNGNLVDLFQIVTCIAGIFSSFFWYLINKGSKFWHENWTHHIDFLEDEFEGKLHKTVLYDGDGSQCSNIKDKKLLDAKTKPYSVSRVNIWISVMFCTSWSGLLFIFLWESTDPSIPLLIALWWPIKWFVENFVLNFLGEGWSAFLFWPLVLVAVLFWCNFKLKSEFDDMYPEKDVRWARRELPNIIKMSSGKKND